MKTSSSLICKLSLLLVSLSPSGDFLQQFKLTLKTLFFISSPWGALKHFITDTPELNTEPLQAC